MFLFFYLQLFLQNPSAAVSILTTQDINIKLYQNCDQFSKTSLKSVLFVLNFLCFAVSQKYIASTLMFKIKKGKF